MLVFRYFPIKILMMALFTELHFQFSLVGYKAHEVDCSIITSKKLGSTSTARLGVHNTSFDGPVSMALVEDAAPQNATPTTTYTCAVTKPPPYEVTMSTGEKICKRGLPERT